MSEVRGSPIHLQRDLLVELWEEQLRTKQLTSGPLAAAGQYQRAADEDPVGRLPGPAAGGPDAQKGDPITAESDLQTGQGGTTGRRQQPHGGGDGLHGNCDQQGADTVEDRPQRNDQGLVITVPFL